MAHDILNLLKFVAATALTIHWPSTGIFVLA